MKRIRNTAANPLMPINFFFFSGSEIRQRMKLWTATSRWASSTGTRTILPGSPTSPSPTPTRTRSCKATWTASSESRATATSPLLRSLVYQRPPSTSTGRTWCVVSRTGGWTSSPSPGSTEYPATGRRRSPTSLRQGYIHYTASSNQKMFLAWKYSAALSHRSGFFLIPYQCGNLYWLDDRLHNNITYQTSFYSSEYFNNYNITL